MAGRSYIVEAYDRWEGARGSHKGGVFNSQWLLDIEKILPESVESSIETGCGKSTILFSNIAKKHTVFAFDDRGDAESSVDFFTECPISKKERVEFVYGPTQITLRHYEHTHKYDVALLDGPHGWPFPEIEYYFIYPQIKPGGFLLVDDVVIPTIARMADIIAEDDMWKFVKVIGATAIFQRTNAPVFPPHGDDWWKQKYNRRRVSKRRDIFLDDGPVVDTISSMGLDDKI